MTAPGLADELLDVRMGHDVLLDPLGALDRLRVLLQVDGELGEERVDGLAQRVLGIGLDGPGEVLDLQIHLVGDEVVDEPRRPRG